MLILYLVIIVRPQLSPFASATLKTMKPHDDRCLKFHIMTNFTSTKLYDISYD